MRALLGGVNGEGAQGDLHLLVGAVGGRGFEQRAHGGESGRAQPQPLAHQPGLEAVGLGGGEPSHCRRKGCALKSKKPRGRPRGFFDSGGVGDQATLDSAKDSPSSGSRST